MLNKQGAGPLQEMALKKEKTPCLGVHLPGDWGGVGWAIYLGAELGCVITAGVMAGLNKRAEGELHFHLRRRCRFDPAAL